MRIVFLCLFLASCATHVPIRPDYSLHCAPVLMEDCEALQQPASKSLQDLVPVMGQWGGAYLVCKAKHQELVKCVRRYESQK